MLGVYVCVEFEDNSYASQQMTSFIGVLQCFLCFLRREVQSVAKRHGLMCREAFHYREHPANQEVARLIQSGAIGQLQEVEVKVSSDIRMYNVYNMSVKRGYCSALRAVQQPSMTPSVFLVG